jgi:DNA-binding MarR family transcriptional regulator
MALAPTGTEREQASTALARSFKATMAAVRRLRGRDTHRPGELSYAQYSLLAELADHGELPAGELATLAALSPATVTQMLDHLAATGLVVRTRSERDRRVVVSRLADAGRELVAARHRCVAPLWTAVIDRLRGVFEALDA